MKTGIYPGLSRAEYDAVEAANFSTIKHLAQSPLHYLAALRSNKDSDARKFGRGAHLATLEPEKVETELVVWTGGRRAGKEWEAFKEGHAGRDILTEEEAWGCAALASAVRDHPVAGPLVRDGHSEVSIFWEYEPIPGVVIPCKGRIDYVNELGFVDLKSTRCAEPSAFARDSYARMYHAQGAFYSDGWMRAGGSPRPTRIIAAESDEPFAVTVFRLPESLLAAGRAEYDKWLSMLALCRATNNWPGYASSEQLMELPRWAQPEFLPLGDETTEVGNV